MECDQKLTVITGTGRCGTSFAAQVFRAAGIDPGGGFDDSVRAGWEFAPVVAVNELILAEVEFPSCSQSDQLLLRWRERMQASIAGVRLVKDPRFSYLLDLWVHAGLIGRVIQLVRPFRESMASAATVWGPVAPRRTVAHYQARVDHVSRTCERHEIPHTLIRFPEVVREEGADLDLLLGELGRLGVPRTRALQACRSTRDPQLVQHTPVF